MSKKSIIHKLIAPEVEALFEAVLLLKNRTEVKAFLRDLLTEKEILEFSNRWRVARLLNKGISYIEIERQIGMSSTTIARVHKWLKKGMGGYRLMLKRIAD